MYGHRLLLAALLASLACLQGCAGVLLVGGATAAAAAQDRRSLGTQIDDKAIVVKANSAIKDAGIAQDIHINVTSLNGIVLLSGEAPTTELRDKVLGAVRTVAGVRRIVNEIRVASVSTNANRTNDTWLTSKVKAKLMGVAKLDSSQVKVVTENATVYLMGLVTKTEGDLAATAASEVNGVASVVKLYEYID